MNLSRLLRVDSRIYKEVMFNSFDWLQSPLVVVDHDLGIQDDVLGMAEAVDLAEKFEWPKGPNWEVIDVLRAPSGEVLSIVAPLDEQAHKFLFRITESDELILGDFSAGSREKFIQVLKAGFENEPKQFGELPIKTSLLVNLANEAAMFSTFDWCDGAIVICKDSIWDAIVLRFESGYEETDIANPIPRLLFSDCKELSKFIGVD